MSVILNLFVYCYLFIAILIGSENKVRNFLRECKKKNAMAGFPEIRSYLYKLPVAILKFIPI